ncbi:MAG: hypothetical protein ACK5LZ_03380 [Anaerorhabdus sp.]
MKKSLLVLILVFSFITMTGFTTKTENEDGFTIESFDQYNREFQSEAIEVCSTSATKTYMSYKAITSTTSKQYKFIYSEMTVDELTGLLYDEDGFIGVALGSSFGEIGTRYYFTLDTGITLPVVKVDAKASVDAPNGCSHSADASVLEFVIDTTIAGEYFGVSNNGYVNQGNFNNDERFEGEIIGIELVLDERLEGGVYYEGKLNDNFEMEKHLIGVPDRELSLEGGY